MAHHLGTAIEYKSSTPREGIRKSLDPAARRWGTATVCRLDCPRDKRPAFLSGFNVNALDELAGDSLSEADSVSVTGAAETTLANQMAAITVEY